ncbi:TrkA C-terminal domain-containing protein [Clostridium gasigenes]|uniref:TrkA C-terminal domain-containing protein n=1 Tax=Clostridium gasigenes TaxID=94869 RepID=UPI0014382D06|nr:TrkA C-terminal domain-containing protein [Clostridium gasigenes]MBU3105927.1 GntR family transcriptional regulator [Clostridium gasigenes]MBU3136503.1 GntR family transcriptional regulator [Clostridium gasigenes]NKF07406.1 GntR family transcriptional regulator [Clostridium gasigenes]QSW18371.1 GntR family transcriptional regulator [Clostridium gasigenes]
MTKQTKTPNYIKIAVDIAHRITNNEFTEGSKISGRTTLVGIYNVSHETIRRSLSLLKDNDVVIVNEKSGIIINSKLKAKEFLNIFKTKSDFFSLNNETFNLIKQKKSIDNQLEKNINSIIEFATQLRNVGSIIPFESIVEDGSVAVNKSIGELNFWQNTKATIIAIKRDGDLFLSPGPYFTIKENDILVYVGDDCVLENIKNYISI